MSTSPSPEQSKPLSLAAVLAASAEAALVSVVFLLDRIHSFLTSSTGMGPGGAEECWSYTLSASAGGLAALLLFWELRREKLHSAARKLHLIGITLVGAIIVFFVTGKDIDARYTDALERNWTGTARVLYALGAEAEHPLETFDNLLHLGNREAALLLIEHSLPATEGAHTRTVILPDGTETVRTVAEKSAVATVVRSWLVNGRPEVCMPLLRALLERGDNPDIPVIWHDTSHPHTPLYYACGYRLPLEGIDLLLRHGADAHFWMPTPNGKMEYETPIVPTPLLYTAAVSGDIDTLKLLLRYAPVPEGKQKEALRSMLEKAGVGHLNP